MRRINHVYHIEGEQIICTASGEVIPTGEPLALFRASDPLAGETLWSYKESSELAGVPHLIVLSNELLWIKFADFQRENPDLMKVPG